MEENNVYLVQCSKCKKKFFQPVSLKEAAKTNAFWICFECHRWSKYLEVKNLQELGGEA